MVKKTNFAILAILMATLADSDITALSSRQPHSQGQTSFSPSF